jgi:undecaprenyl-diphosphatase
MPLLGLLEQIVRWLEPVFRGRNGYVVLSAAVFLEHSFLLGLIAPGDLVLALGGVYAARGELSIWWVGVIGGLAAMAGDSTGYWLGRRYGRSIVHRLPIVGRFENKLDDVQAYFERRGGITVALGRYAAIAGAFVPFVAGMSSMAYPRFLAWEMPAVLVWAAGVPTLGFVFGRNLDFIEEILNRFGWGILIAFVLVIGARILWRRRQGNGTVTRAP